MKTKILVGVLSVSVLLTGGCVSAAEESSSNFNTQEFFEEEVAIVEPGVLPSSFWYWGDKFAEQIQFVFTVGKEKKADLLMDLAKERLAEMQKLSEEGITKYADQLLTEHETSITKAQELYEDLRQEGIERAKELQEDTEKEILLTEKKLKNELGQAEETYLEKQDNFAKRLGSWMRKVTSHLSWKGDQIQEQRSEMFDE